MTEKQIVSSKYRGTKKYLLVYTELINAARYRGLITYQEIAQIMGLPLQGSHMGREVGYMIGEISEEEHDQKRPMISALTVGVNGKPGSGFYALAKEFGRNVPEDKVGQLAFWEKERQAVYDLWAPLSLSAGSEG